MLKLLNLRSLILVLFSVILFSCANKKKIIYFQGDKKINSESNKNFNTILRNDDLLSITVMGMDGEAVKPFNLATYGNSSLNNNGSEISGNNKIGYLIDANGQIEFPVIGKIKIAGLNRSEASEFIKEKLKDYLKDPMVNIQILNFKITILGDINRPGTYSIPNERVTLIEAIGMAGDLNLSGIRKNILVIRDMDGNKTETRVDLTSKEIFNSPVFYLQQNDVVYIEHNRAKKNSSVINVASISIFVSLTTLVLTSITLLTR